MLLERSQVVEQRSLEMELFNHCAQPCDQLGASPRGGESFIARADAADARRLHRSQRARRGAGVTK